MNLVFAAAIAVILGCAVYAMLGRDLIGLFVGAVLLSAAVNVTLLAAGLLRGASPILEPHETPPSGYSDPLVQALALTAIVISFALTGLLLAVGYASSWQQDTLDQVDLTRDAGAPLIGEGGEK